MAKELLFSITKKDFEIQTFRSGGKGGQHQNKTESGVRIIHKASGAVGEARDNRSQYINKKAAFNRLVSTKLFKNWMKVEIAKRSGELTIEDRINKWVEEQMDPKYIKVEEI